MSTSTIPAGQRKTRRGSTFTSRGSEAGEGVEPEKTAEEIRTSRIREFTEELLTEQAGLIEEEKKEVGAPPPKQVEVIDPGTGETTLKNFFDVTKEDIAATPGLGDVVTAAEPEGESFILPFSQKEKAKRGRGATLLTGGRGVRGRARTQRALLGGF